PHQGVDAVLQHLRFAHHDLGLRSLLVVVLLVDARDLGLEVDQVFLALATHFVLLRLIFAAQHFNLALEVFFQTLEGLLARILIDAGDDVLREIQHAVEVAAADVEQNTEVAGDAPRVPYVGHRRGELNMTQTRAADRRARHFDATLVADDPAIAYVLILTTIALKVARGAKDRLAKEAILLGTQTAIVDRLGLGNLPIRPRPDFLGRCQADTQCAKVFRLQGVPPLRLRSFYPTGVTYWCNGYRIPDQDRVWSLPSSAEAKHALSQHTQKWRMKGSFKRFVKAKLSQSQGSLDSPRHPCHPRHNDRTPVPRACPAL